MNSKKAPAQPGRDPPPALQSRAPGAARKLAPGVSPLGRGRVRGSALWARFIFPLVVLPLTLGFSCSVLNREVNPRMESRDFMIECSGVPPVPIRAELARAEEERNRGLMHRKELADGEGMLFIHERDQLLSFWMKNTLIPLSVAYISAEGRILEIHPLEPGNLRPVRSNRSARYALEVPRDWFSRAGIDVGDILRLDPLWEKAD